MGNPTADRATRQLTTTQNGTKRTENNKSKRLAYK